MQQPRRRTRPSALSGVPVRQGCWQRCLVTAGASRVRPRALASQVSQRACAPDLQREARSPQLPACSIQLNRPIPAQPVRLPASRTQLLPASVSSEDSLWALSPQASAAAGPLPRCGRPTPSRRERRRSPIRPILERLVRRRLQSRSPGAAPSEALPGVIRQPVPATCARSRLLKPAPSPQPPPCSFRQNRWVVPARPVRLRVCANPLLHVAIASQRRRRAKAATVSAPVERLQQISPPVQAPRPVLCRFRWPQALAARAPPGPTPPVPATAPP